MKVFVIDNIHLYKDPEGNYYSATLYDYKFLSRYLNVFDTVKFIGKVRSIDEAYGKKLKLVSGPKVEILELPWYQGLYGMVLKLPELISIYTKSCLDVDTCIFRIAQIESFFVYIFGKPKNMKFGVEVVNDPETFTNLLPFLRKFNVLFVKKMVKEATCASYVTEYVLQNKYLAKSTAYVTHYSSIELNKDDIYNTPIKYTPGNTFKIVHVSNAINNDIKGHSTVIRVINELVKKGCKVEIDFIGDGTKVNYYIDMAKKLEINNQIHFIGRLYTKSELMKKLRSYNMMLLPTRMEGLPRTIIEACAVGLPCLSTPIAGIPEIIESDYLFHPDDYKGFANKIQELMLNPLELLQMSRINLTKAKDYTSDVLTNRRDKMYLALKNACLQKNGEI